MQQNPHLWYSEYFLHLTNQEGKRYQILRCYEVSCMLKEKKLIFMCEKQNQRYRGLGYQGYLISSSLQESSQ